MQAVLLPGLLAAATLGASACGNGGDAGSTDLPRATGTPVGPRASTTPAASQTPGRRALRPGPPRTPEALLKHIAGRRVKAAGRTIRIDVGTVTCDGLGRPSRQGQDKPAWTVFRCIQPTFPPGSVAGPDLIFVVQSIAPRELVVTRRYFTSY